MSTADTVLERPASATPAKKPKAPKTPRTPAAEAAAAAVEAAPEPKLNSQLVVVNETLAEYDRVEAGLASFRTKYENVAFAVATPEGMEEAKAARTELREVRYGIDRAAKAAKAPLNQLKKDIDQRGEEITAQLVELETPVHQQIKAEEDRVEAEKQAAKKAKEEAAARAQTAIDGIRAKAVAAVSMTAADIDAARTELTALETSLEEFGGRAGEALQAKNQVLEQLDTLHAAAVARELRDAEAAEQRATLERMQAEQAERERVANEEREARETAEREQREKQTREAQEKLDRERAEFEREQQETRARNAAEETRLREEREEVERTQAAARREKDQREAAERQEAEAKATQLRTMRMQEIEGIRQQVTIAQVGRAPYYRGDNAEDARKIIAETEAWEITEEKFGDQYALAQNAKTTTLSALAGLLGQFETRERQAEERRRQEAEQAADLMRRNASGVMLAALRTIADEAAFKQMHPAVQLQVTTAIQEATGEAA